MKAINYYLIIDKVKQEPKKVGGLELTEKQNKDERYIKGHVISVGNSIEGIKAGDNVRYDKHAGHGIEHKGKLYYVIKFTDVVVVE
jgi:co-chaperonin GroES (HSP10)